MQGMHLTYGHHNMELAGLGMEAISMLTSSLDAHAQVCGWTATMCPRSSGFKQFNLQLMVHIVGLCFCSSACQSEVFISFD